MRSYKTVQEMSTTVISVDVDLPVNCELEITNSNHPIKSSHTYLLKRGNSDVSDNGDKEKAINIFSDDINGTSFKKPRTSEEVEEVEIYFDAVEELEDEEDREESDVVLLTDYPNFNNFPELDDVVDDVSEEEEENTIMSQDLLNTSNSTLRLMGEYTSKKRRLQEIIVYYVLALSPNLIFNTRPFFGTFWKEIICPLPQKNWKNVCIIIPHSFLIFPDPLGHREAFILKKLNNYGIFYYICLAKIMENFEK